MSSGTPASRTRSKKLLSGTVSGGTVELPELITADEPRKAPSKKQRCSTGRRVTKTRSLRKQKIGSDVNTPSKHVAKALEQLHIDAEMKHVERPSYIITKAVDCVIKFKRKSLQRKSEGTIGTAIDEGKLLRSPLKKLKYDPNLDDEDVETGSVPNLTLEKVIHLLHTSEIPDELPCRENEYVRVYKDIERIVKHDGISQTTYVCGLPGTGKTATALKNLRKRYSFKVSVVNAMEITDPKNVFVKIYTDLFDCKKRITSSSARIKLDRLLETGTSDGSSIVLVIDEFDLLCNTRQEIVYDVLNWTERSLCPLGVIAIANTFDLKERFLARRIMSRMGVNRIQFQPYNREELKSIILYRLRNCEVVQNDAVELACRKIASVSGDLRKALDLISHAARIAIKEGNEKVTINTVLKAFQEFKPKSDAEFVGSLSIHPRILLRSALELQRSGKSHFSFSEMLHLYQDYCVAYDIVALSSTFVFDEAMEMSCSHLLIAAPGTSFMGKKFRLGMTPTEAQAALDATKSVEDEVFQNNF